jgi:K+-transporting ATPase ATPase C chain
VGSLTASRSASALIGQPADGPEWFHPRPSAAGDGYDGAASGASNLGPTSDELLDLVGERVDAYRAENGLDDRAQVPVDAVTASGSGLDPHISLANAQLQAPRVAAERGLDDEVVADLIDDATQRRPLGVLGERWRQRRPAQPGPRERRSPLMDALRRLQP